MAIDYFSTAENGLLILLGGFAAFQTYRERRANKAKQAAEVSKVAAEAKNGLIEGKNETIATLQTHIKALKEQNEDWKNRFQTEHEDYAKYRDGRHEADQKTNALILGYTAEIADLRAKTDLTPFKDAQEQQSKINGRMLDGMARAITILEMLERRLEKIVPIVKVPEHPDRPDRKPNAA